MSRPLPCILAAGALATSALAWAAPAAAQTVAIINAKIETVSSRGEIPSGVLIIKDGKILSVGATAAVPDGAQVIDAHGGVITPGLIDPSTNLGLAEVDEVRTTRDDRSGPSLGAGFDLQYGINPDSTLIPLARLGGVTRAVVTPVLSSGGDGSDEETSGSDALTGGGSAGAGDPGLFAGQAAIFRLAAQDPNSLVKAQVAETLNLGEAGAAAGGSRGAAMVLVKSALDDARDYARNRAGFERGAARPYGLSRVDLEALVPVVEGRTPLLVRVHRASDIRDVLKLAADEKLKLILEGAEEGWMVAADLAKAGVPVLIDTEAALPDQFETLGSRLDNAARLQAAGVTVAIEGSRDFNNLRQERFNAGTAVANGLPYAAALAAITANPARIWGLDAHVGSLAPGMDADVVVWNGDPLETTSYPVAVFIAGRAQPMTSRALELRDRYLNPDKSYPPAYH